jgi:hypothetical protein
VSIKEPLTARPHRPTAGSNGTTGPADLPVGGGRSFAKFLIGVCDAEEAVNPRGSLLAVHTCGKVSVERGVRAFVASSQKVRSDRVWWQQAALTPSSSASGLAI